MTEREGCIALNMLSGIGFVKYKALLDVFGSADGIKAASRSDLLQVDGIGKILAERVVNFDWDAELSRELGMAERGAVRIYTLADDDYPAELRQLYDPPLVLYVRGKLPENADRSLAVVGSRRISAYGEKLARNICEEAVVNGFTIVSGMAVGTDTVAHQTVVDMAGKTIGVLGGGFLHMHPRENIQLAHNMVQGGGAIVSEFPLNFPVFRTNFPRRNRIVAALSRATLVIEAGMESGALITARLAAELGREVFALPGRVDNPQAQGCHKLIKDGAGLVENFDDIMEALCMGLRPGQYDASTRQVVGSEELEPDCAAIYDLLKNGDADLEELCEATGMDAGRVLATIMKLELKLLVERDAQHYYHLIAKKHGLANG